MSYIHAAIATIFPITLSLFVAAQALHILANTFLFCFGTSFRPDLQLFFPTWLLLRVLS
jgi:hypothetical protein